MEDKRLSHLGTELFHFLLYLSMKSPADVFGICGDQILVVAR